MKASSKERLLRVVDNLSFIGLAFGVLAVIVYFIEPIHSYFWMPLAICVVIGFFWAYVNSIKLPAELDDPYLRECNQASGTIQLDTGQMLISDHWDLSTAVRIDVQPGEYAVRAVSKDGYVTHVKLHLIGESGVAKQQKFQVVVDSGHLTFADSSIIEKITPKQIEKRILTVLSSQGPLTLILKDEQGVALGYVVSTGMGDGAYQVRTNSAVPATCVACKF